MQAFFTNNSLLFLFSFNLFNCTLSAFLFKELSDSKAAHAQEVLLLTQQNAALKLQILELSLQNSSYIETFKRTVFISASDPTIVRLLLIALVLVLLGYGASWSAGVLFKTYSALVAMPGQLVNGFTLSLKSMIPFLFSSSTNTFFWPNCPIVGWKGFELKLIISDSTNKIDILIRKISDPDKDVFYSLMQFFTKYPDVVKEILQAMNPVTNPFSPFL